MLAEHPITLPHLRPSVQIPVPGLPTEPPLDGDLVAARVYHTILRDLSDERELSDEKRPTTEELTDALRYLQDVKDRIWTGRGDPIQELGRQMNQRFNEMNAQMNARFDRIEETQADVMARLNHVSRQQNHSSILPLMTGRWDQLNLGRSPIPGWFVAHGGSDIDTLREDQRAQYCRGYGFAAVGNVAQQKATIRRALGMSR
ncbi:hypothetical protein V1506DRAFT_522979 [Lipomyces tetrasporus]